MAYTREGKWIGPCGCEVCEKWADCDYCDGCTPRTMEVNLVEIIEDANGFSSTVTLANGFNECISGLYDLDDALSYGRMHVSYQTNKYVGRG